MKILLVQPAPFEPGRLGLENVVWMSEPVALTSLAAMLPEHDVRILDMRLEQDLTYNEMLCDFEPDFVGTTSMTTDCYQAKALLTIAKSTLGSQIFTIVGGHHPTLAPEDFEDVEVVDALCIGEGEYTILELVQHLVDGKSKHEMHHINGLRFVNNDGVYVGTPKRSQEIALDDFPAPARHLLKPDYKKEYFFQIANPMASMSTSRGCSFDCNFCAIWEFYERKTRYMSAKVICDRLETMEEKFVFFLDDNFLTDQKRLVELCEEIEKRGIKKYLATQGRSDFIADNPDVMRRLRDCGLMMVLSGYETNDDSALDYLRKKNTMAKNRKAAEIMRELGMISTGIFMVRQDFSEDDFDRLYDAINDMGIAVPLITILTPLPGTELWRAREDELLTKDTRLFDLLHSVLPTKLPREVFYKKLTEYNRATWKSFKKGIWASIRRRPKFFIDALPGLLRFMKKANHYRPILENHESHLRDEKGIIPPNITTANAAKKKPRKLPLVQETV
jgi:hopanoid C-3 methylase